MLALFAQASDPGIMSPGLQYGAFSISAMLIGVIIWQFRELLGVMRDNQKVIDANSRVIEQALKSNESTQEMVRDIRDRLMERPCIAGVKQK